MLSDHVADQVTHWRRRRGWNRERLAEECKAQGMELTPATLTNIESGRRQDGVRRRQVTVDELMVLGSALRVPPFLLITPVGEDIEIEVAPGKWIDPWDAFTVSSGLSLDLAQPELYQRVSLYVQHDQAVREYLAGKSKENLDLIIAIRGQIRANGWRLPRVPPSGMAYKKDANELRSLIKAAELSRGITSPTPPPADVDQVGVELP